MIQIRAERPEDVQAIRWVNELAFGRRSEAELVEALRLRREPLISLVALQDARLVGHILFSPVRLTSEIGVSKLMGLGPMAVLPAYQRQGIGSRLVTAGLDACQRAGHEIVVVLGHPSFYPRFGFVPSKPLGIRWEHNVPPEAFMVAELDEGALAGRRGIISYQPEFDGV